MAIQVVVESVEPEFKPIGIEITLNTQQDVDAFFSVCNSGVIENTHNGGVAFARKLRNTLLTFKANNK